MCFSKVFFKSLSSVIFTYNVQYFLFSDTFDFYQKRMVMAVPNKWDPIIRPLPYFKQIRSIELFFITSTYPEYVTEQKINDHKHPMQMISKYFYFSKTINY